MLAAAALGALGAQLEQLRAAKQDWCVGASLVDEQDISLEADGAVTLLVAVNPMGFEAMRIWLV
jgi:hypothetical protein